MIDKMEPGAYVVKLSTGSATVLQKVIVAGSKYDYR